MSNPSLCKSIEILCDMEINNYLMSNMEIKLNEEIERLAPIIERVKRNFDIPISLDTYKSKVAIAGIDAGADMINDIWGLLYDREMAKVIAASGVVCCLMHNRKEAVYQSFFEEVVGSLPWSAVIINKSSSVIILNNEGNFKSKDSKAFANPKTSFLWPYF